MSRAEPELLAAAATTTFTLNGRLLALADELARPAGLTAACWQVLGAVVDEPRTVSDIARRMGLARQSVQRTADAVVARGFAHTIDNPAHKRARLVELTDEGRAAIRRIGPQQARAARRLATALGGEEKLRAVVDSLRTLLAAVEELP